MTKVEDKIIQGALKRAPIRLIVGELSPEEMKQFLSANFKTINRYLIERKQTPVEDKISQGILDNLSQDAILAQLTTEEMETFLRDNFDIVKKSLGLN
jgi:hypothetical protein|tara:strand:+ start:603 stop:896 length:294 start_codon:yes stop_codon:yes gene_type:complete